MKLTSMLVIILLGALASGAALADRGGHARFGVFIGAPLLFGPWYYPAPYYYSPYPYPYYYPPALTAPVAPPAYIEQGSGGQAAPMQSQAYWYYCADANAYYPYVKECPGGWQRVAPQPPPGS